MVMMMFSLMIFMKIFGHKPLFPTLFVQSIPVDLSDILLEVQAYFEEHATKITGGAYQD